MVSSSNAGQNQRITAGSSRRFLVSLARSTLDIEEEGAELQTPLLPPFPFFSFFYKDCHLFLDERKKNARGLANGFTVTNQFGTVNTLCHSSIKYGR
jgi:hypothetical protein